MARQNILAEARRRMVEWQLRARGIQNEKVLDAFDAVPRELFIPGPASREAYDDRPLSIGHGQTISQPYIVALMTELIEPRPGMRVLEIGTGSGYQAAILAECGAQVYSVEVIPQLHRWAGVNLEKTGHADAVHLRLGNGYLGWPEEAPFDAALLTCSPPRLPPAIAEQVATGGAIVAPIGAFPVQDLVLFRIGEPSEASEASYAPGEPSYAPGKKTVTERRVTGVLFVPMVDVEP